MPVTIDWPEIAVRLALTVLAGALLGLNRTERGMTAGLRTTLLVCLAASVSMVQVNLLLAAAGRAADSFVMLDLMRLPLGVLTGMGFIGAGAIIREKGRVSGVTTAATLWLATALGLCFGGGQHGLGLAALGIGIVVLWALKRVEVLIPQERRGRLSLAVEADGPTDEEVRAVVSSGGGRCGRWNVRYERGRRSVSCEVRWPDRPSGPPAPPFVHTLAERAGVSGVRWRAQ